MLPFTVIRSNSILMQTSIISKRLTAWQEVNYLCTYIHQFRRYYQTLAKIEVHTNIAPCNQRIDHDLLMPFIDDAFRFGVFKISDPTLMFDLQLEKDYLTFGMHYRINTGSYDERTQVTFLKMKNKLEETYPGKHILYRDYYLDTYLVILQIQLT